VARVAKWKRPSGDQNMTRREVARALNLHQDSVSRALADGLGSAVVSWAAAGARWSSVKSW
jgi:hypothetical protein